MGGGFNRKEPSNTKRIHLHPLMVDIFRRHQWLGFFELLKGYDDDITFEFSMALDEPQYCSKDATTPRVANFTLSIEGLYKLGGDNSICTAEATVYSCHFSTRAINH